MEEVLEVKGHAAFPTLDMVLHYGIIIIFKMIPEIDRWCLRPCDWTSRANGDTLVF